MILRRLLFFAASFCLLGLNIGTFAQAAGAVQPPAKPLPFVSTIFGDNMVLQRGKPDAIWGWSQPGDNVRVEIGGHSATAVAASDGRWQVKIDPPKAGGPYTLKITGHESVELKNVMVGDVWLCGGQSNMQLPLRFTLNGEDEVKAANFPEIRYFTVAEHVAYRKSDVVEGTWKAVSPDTASFMSAVAYYFARKLQPEIHVPIGLVIDAVGGTPAEAWTSADALAPLHDFDVPLADVQKLDAAGAPQYGNFIMHWYDDYDLGVKQKWFAPELDDADWKTVDVPGGFAELGVPDAPAVVWFRKVIDVPDPVPAGRALVLLGSIERMDTVYINGVEIGASSWVENPRAYRVPDGVLKPGKNLIAIRVFKTKPNGGFMAKPADLHLVLGDKSSIALAGQWKAKLSVDARPPHPLPVAWENWPVMPAVLYNGMLAPVAPLAIKGAIWYQGEQNSTRGYQYRKILPAMIADWRNVFGQGDFPFLIAGLPRFSPRSATPTDDGWADIRESQAIAAKETPDSCLAVSIDTGEADNIHPKLKQPVGDRLAFCALDLGYHKHVVDSGPTLKSVDRLPGEIKLHFAHTDGGLVVKGDKLAEFSIAGDDKKWYCADARLDGKTIIVSSPQVPHPVEVRYAWQSNPEATLFNGAGLPAAPFRTDTWPLITQDANPY
ncbi:MAG TPA: sialate O-acetylesterase [Terracidiphilus sp.]|nr:sialate O-acetylesterase [Terracidiphilus sp.]